MLFHLLDRWVMRQTVGELVPVACLRLYMCVCMYVCMYVYIYIYIYPLAAPQYFSYNP